MVSLASRPELRNDPKNGNGEMIDMAWEMDNPDSTSDIEYQPYLHIPGDTVYLHSFDDLTWTKVSVACANFHPMVAVKPPVADSFGMPVVTWESFHKANVREMTVWNSSSSLTAWTPKWSSVKMFTPQASGSWITSNLPLPQVRIENALCSGYAVPLQKELIYQDTFNHFERIHRYEPNVKGKYDWTSETKLREYAQQGSVSMPYGGLFPASPDPDSSQDPGVMTFRGIWADDSNEFAVNIVTSPPAEQTVPAVIVPTFSLFALKNVSAGYGVDCYGVPIYIGTGPALVQHPDTNINPPDTGGIRWNESNVGNYTTTSIDDSQSVLTDSVWPVTQDSVRTDYFSAQSAFGIDMSRLLLVDTTQLDSLLPNASHWITYKLVVKDSASGLIMQTIDSATITGPSQLGFAGEPGVDPNDTMITGQGYRIWNTINPTPSGSAYMTIIITKDSLTQAELDETDVYCDSLALPIPSYDTSSSDSGDGPPPPVAIRPDTVNQNPVPLSSDSADAMAVNTAQQISGDQGQSSPSASSPSGSASSSEAVDNVQQVQPSTSSPLPVLDVTVHPNPARDKVRICVADLPPGIPAVVDVVNDLGERVAKLYDATPDAELGLCLTLDCTQLASGIYYADLQANGSHKAVQFSVQH